MERKNKILIIVDAQNDFITGTLANKDADLAVPKICDLITKYKDCNKIVLTRDTHGPNYLDTPEGKALPIEHCIRESAGWCVDDRILKTLRENNIKNYSYIDKYNFGYLDWGYDGWDNDSVELIICGFVTDICVISNALILKAKYPKAKTTVVSDCCAGLTPEKHQAALEVMKSCQIEVI